MAREKAGLTQLDLAKRINQKFGLHLTQPTIQRIEVGKVKATSFIAEIADICGVDPLWLSAGSGEMLINPNNKNMEVGSSTEEQDLLDIFRQMNSPNVRAQFRALGNTLLKLEQNPSRLKKISKAS